MRRPRGRGFSVLATLVATLGLISCGDDTDPSDSPPDPPPIETADRPADLPKGWNTVTNQAAGFTVGLPPDWEEQPQEGGKGTILSSPDRLSAVTISADRSAGALGLEPGEFATRTAEALARADAGRGGLQEDIAELRSPRTLDHPYDAAVVAGTGTSTAAGTPERIEVAVLRRPELAVYVIVARSIAEAQSEFVDPDTVARIFASLRGTPPA